METSCKQVSWCPFSEEETSMTSKEEESSSCSLVHNLMSINCNRMQDNEECSMCGDVGLPQYLFKCLTCSHRYQHIYCSKFYPYRIEATTCNWCLPMEQLVNNTIAEVDGTKVMKFSNSINYTDRNTKADIDANSNCPIDLQVQKLEKHTKAFEYLLQVAELHDQGHQWDNAARPIKEFSEKNCVRHCQNNEICRFYEVGHIAKELDNQEPVSLMMHQFIISGCSNDQDGSFYTIRGGDKIDYVKGPSTTSTQLQYSHSHGHDQIGMNQDIVGNSLIIKKNLCQDLGYDQIMKKFNNQGLGHNQTIKKLNDQLDQAHVRQEPAIRPVKSDHHEIGCSDSDDQSLKLQDASSVKRARLHKQLQAAVGGNSHSINAADQQKMYSQAAYNVCSGDSDQQLAGKFCDNTGPAKRPRHRQSEAQVIAGDNYVLNPAIRQRAVAGTNDQANTSAADQHRVLGINQSSAAHAWSRPAGKRDHLMNSPSRAINRRYKLLADVLC